MVLSTLSLPPCPCPHFEPAWRSTPISARSVWPTLGDQTIAERRPTAQRAAQSMSTSTSSARSTCSLLHKYTMIFVYRKCTLCVRVKSEREWKQTLLCAAGRSSGGCSSTSAIERSVPNVLTRRRSTRLCASCSVSNHSVCCCSEAHTARTEDAYESQTTGAFMSRAEHRTRNKLNLK